MRNHITLLVPGALALTAGVAVAQPVPLPPYPPTPTPAPTGTPPPPAGDQPPSQEQYDRELERERTEQLMRERIEELERERREREASDQAERERLEHEADMEPRPRHPLPELLLAPAGVMLPGGVFYSRSGLDTSGGFSSDLRFGLGDVAEFGVAMTDLVRARPAGGLPTERLQPYFTATFRMGIAEHRLFRYQPALVLGFRKSFEYEDQGHASRIAELHLAATWHLGANAAIHLNGAVWDASVQSGAEAAVVLHDQGLREQLRFGGGIEIRAVDDADVMVDVAWVPELCYACTIPNRIELRPVLSWGVRYDLTRWAQLQSGVRVPDIGDANLLDAQIFGQVTFINSALRRMVKRDRRR